METLCPLPTRLTDLSLRHDGPRPTTARALALATSAEAAWQAGMMAKAHWFETLALQCQSALVRTRRRTSDLAQADAALAKLSLSLATYRNEAVRSLAHCQRAPWPK